LFNLCPGVAKRDGTVEHQPTLRRIRVHAEVSLPFKLKAIAGFSEGETLFHLAIRQDFE
jgi:hypothetical protein